MTVSRPGLAVLVGYSYGHLAVLKLDCEGCKYSLYRDIITHDAAFLHRVDQLVLEVHLSRTWAPTDGVFIEYGRLLGLLRRANFVVFDARFGHCSQGQPLGLTPLVYKSRYYDMTPRRKDNTSRNRHCENLLFARHEKDRMALVS